MLTRGGRKARVAVRPEAAHAALAPLPLLCVLDILSRLAPGERLLSAAVSRGWRAAVCQPLMWTSVDLSQGASLHRASDALLAAVVNKAAGQITNLRLTLCRGPGVSTAAILAAVTANGGALRHLDLRNSTLRAAESDCLFMSKNEVDGLLRAAPGLLSFDADVLCTRVEETQVLLAGQGQYSVAHIRRLAVGVFSRRGGDVACTHHPFTPFS